jgi:autotransporter-associated beta strand protein
LFFAFYGGAQYAAADTFTWTGNSGTLPGTGNNNWTNLFNWQGGIPDNDGTADIVMPDTPRDNPNVNQPWSIKSFTFQGPGNYSVNGDPLTLNDITHDGTGAVTFKNSVGVSGAGAVWRAGSGPMTFNGAITGSEFLTLLAPQGITFDGSAANTLSGPVSINEGTLVLSKSSLNGAIAGNLRINGGTARWGASDQVTEQPGTAMVISNGGVADVNGKDEIFAQVGLSSGGRVESTGGRLVIETLLLQDASEVDLGAGELRIQGLISRFGNSSTSTSRIAADVISLGSTENVFSVVDSPAAVELEVAGEITADFESAQVQKVGEGALRLTRANTYQGGTTILAGTLIVDNPTGSGTGTGTVTVQIGARLGGSGAIAGTVGVALDAAIAPSGLSGSPIGSLAIGGLSMNTTSQFEVQFNQALPVQGRRDVLTVTNNASLNGILVIENLNANLLPSPSATHTILAAASITGSFANAPNGTRLDTVDGSGSFIVNYGPGSAFDPTNVVLSDFLAEGIAGDFDNDGDVDGRDFLVWQRGGSPAPLSPGDLADWKSNFGATGGIGAVPEPAAGMLVAMGFAAVAICRGRLAGRSRGVA